MKKRKPGTFAEGNRAACGKHAPGSGRPPDWLKAKCQGIIKDKKLIEFLGDVASGEPVRNAVAIEGEKPVEGAKVSADIKDRLRAAEMLLDRGFGKAEQAVVGKDGGPIEISVRLVKYG